MQEKPRRTSHRSAHRKNYMASDGRYVYYRWDEETQKEIPVYLTPGEDGVTTEWVIMLDECDHDEDLKERYDMEHKDYHFENARTVQTDDGSGESVDAVTIEDLPDPDADLLNILFPDRNNESPQITKLRQCMEKLTPAQRELVYALYGLRQSVIEIARSEGVTEAAIRNRRTKLLNRLKKLFSQMR